VKPSPVARLLALVVVAVIPVGCPVYLDFYDASQSASATSSGAGPGTGGGAGTGTSGTGGVGGVCVPASIAPCYDGPAGTEGHGLCQAGSKMCNAEGTAYGPCVGEVLPTPEDCATATDEDCDGLAPACKGNLVWSERFGDATSQRAQSVAVDGSGSVLLGGWFYGAIDFGGASLVSAGLSDGFLAKLDAGGNHLWSKRFGDAESQQVTAIAVDNAGYVVIAGTFAGVIDLGGGPLTSKGGLDVFLAKLDPAGNHVWSRSFGDAKDQSAVNLAVDGSGNVLLSGDFLGTLDFGDGQLTSAGGLDVFLAKLDAAGNHLWSKSFGDTDDQKGLRVAANGAGDILVGGDFFGMMDLGGGPLPTMGGNDVVIAKLNSAGNHLWSKRFSGASDQVQLRFALDEAGDAVLAGGFTGSVDLGGGALTSVGGLDLFLAKLSADGNHVWSERFGDENDQSPASLALDSSGNVVLTGDLQGAVNFGGGPLGSVGGFDVFLAKLDAGGHHLWSQRFGDAADQRPICVAVDSSNNIFLTGDLEGSADFGNGSLVSTGASDVFVAKFRP
jgi:predicted nucleic acid-binding protein